MHIFMLLLIGSRLDSHSPKFGWLKSWVSTYKYNPKAKVSAMYFIHFFIFFVSGSSQKWPGLFQASERVVPPEGEGSQKAGQITEQRWGTQLGSCWVFVGFWWSFGLYLCLKASFIRWLLFIGCFFFKSLEQKFKFLCNKQFWPLGSFGTGHSRLPFHGSSHDLCPKLGWWNRRSVTRRQLF